MGKRAKLNYGVEQVEPRLLLSADLAMGFTPGWSPEAEPLQSDLELLPPLEAPAEPDKSTHQNKTSLTLPAALDLEAISNLGAPTTAESEAELAPNAIRNELIVIDGSIADYHQLLEGLQSQNDPTLQREVHVIDPSADGVQILTDLLSNYNNLDAVHIVSHGDTSGIALGASRLDSNSLADYEQSINAWSSALTDGADLLLYGCNLAQGHEGQAFIDGLSALTGADVAASDDSTGHAILGGDWDLEYSTGDVETSIAFDLQAQQNWLSVLPITSRETVDADGDGMVDHIKMTASGAFNDDFSDLNVTVSGYTLDAGSSYITDLGAGGALDNVFYLKLVESGSADTDATPTVTVAANSNLDIAGSTVATDAGVVATDKAAAVVLSKETADLNGDGSIDAIQVKFSEAILDSTVSAGDWDVAGVTVDPFVSTTDGDTADDADIYITFTDGVLDTGATPDVTYTQNATTDLSGNLLAGDDTATWWDTDWQNRTRITFDNSASATALTDFPVLVTLTTADVDFDKIKAGGADIRFVDDDGFELNYEIESWDDTVGSESATIWVKVKSLEATNTDFIHLYYNNTAASTADPASAAGVWDAGHKGVYHLSEDFATAGAGGILDSTSNDHNGTDTGGMDSNDQITGMAGGSVRFNSSAEYIDFGDVDDFDFGLSDFSVSFWVKGGAGGDAFLTKSLGNGPFDGIYLYQSNSQNTNTWYGPGYNKFDEDGSDGEWHHLAAVREGTGAGEFKVYTDGVEANTAALGTDLTNIQSFMMHRWADDVSTNAVTQMDEVRLSNTARTADWIEASYLSQNGAFAFSTFGSEQVSVTDKAAPVINARETVDSDGNGQIDQIKITTSETLDDDFAGLTMAVDGYTVSGYSSDIANDNIFYVDLTESSTADTDATPTATVVTNTTLSEFGGANNIATDGGTAATDKSAVVITARETVDSDANGQIDQIQITTSEALDDNFAGLTITVDGYAVSGYSSDIANDNIFYVDLTESGTPDTGATPTVTLTANTTLSDAGNNDDIAVDASWLDANWQNRAKIRFDNAAQTTDNLDEFPVLVTIDTTLLPSLSLSTDKGADVRFTDAISGTELKYEVETWDDGADTATIWVKVPRIDMASNTDYIYVYYNHSGTATYDQTAADEAAVWDVNHIGVYHLEEQSGGTHDDSTGVHDGTRVNNVYYAGEGRYAQTFDGTGDYVSVADHNDFDFVDGGGDTAFSVSAWIQGETGNGEIVNKYADAPGGWEIYTVGGQLHFDVVDTDNDYIGRYVTAPVSGAWQHVTGTYDGSETEAGIKLYVDGVEVSSSSSLGAYDGMITTTLEVEFGAYEGGGNPWDFNGQIDEVRISSAERSADWIKASFLSQNRTFAFNNFASEETMTAGVTATDKAAPVATITRDDANPTNATSVNFSVDFSEDVTGVDAADFALDLSGVTANSTVTVGDAGDADASTYTITVDTIASDGTLGLDFAGIGITDLVANTINTTPITDELYTIINVAPVLGAIGNQSVDELAPLAFTATATDDPADNLTFSLDAASITAGMSIDATTGAFSWTPTETQGGTTPSVTITVTDDGTGTLFGSETFIITVNIETVVVTEPTPTIETPTPEIVVDTISPEPISDEPELTFTPTPVTVAVNSRNLDPQIVAGPVVVTERAADVVLSEGQIQAKTGAAVEEELEAELEAKIVPPEVIEFELDNAVYNSSAPVALEEGLVRVLDQVRDKKGEDILIENPTLSASTGVAASMSVGYVAWLLRGGVLLSSVLSQLPAWRSIDPLPVFSHGGKRDEDEEDESLEAIMQKGSTQRDPVSDHADDAAQPSTQDSADGADEHR